MIPRCMVIAIYVQGMLNPLGSLTSMLSISPCPGTDCAFGARPPAALEQTRKQVRLIPLREELVGFGTSFCYVQNWFIQYEFVSRVERFVCVYWMVLIGVRTSVHSCWSPPRPH